MTLEHWFFLSQTVAAFATVAAVSFVALEMRNSTRERRHRTIENVLEDLREARRALAENSDVFRIFLAVYTISRLLLRSTRCGFY